MKNHSSISSSYYKILPYRAKEKFILRDKKGSVISICIQIRYIKYFFLEKNFENKNNGLLKLWKKFIIYCG